MPCNMAGIVVSLGMATWSRSLARMYVGTYVSCSQSIVATCALANHRVRRPTLVLIFGMFQGSKVETPRIIT